MKHYHVYGMGNALVDIEFYLSDALLKELGIEKGVMTLVDDATQETLFAKLSHLNHHIACGGSGGNTVITTQALGGTTFYSCRVAEDKMGDLYYQGLLDMGVETNLSPDRRPTGKTGRCIVKITPDAERTMCTYLGVTADYSHHEIQETALTHSDYLYIEGYLVASDSARLAAMRAKRIAEKHQVKTAITLSDPNMIRYFKEGLNAMIGAGVDLLFCNEAEAKLFCESDDLNHVITQLKKIARTFAITLGAKGAVVFDGTTLHEIPTQSVKVLNTVGAGDVFAGAFLYGLTQGYTFCDATHLANRAAAKVVTQLGPRLSREDCLLVKKSHEHSC